MAKLPPPNGVVLWQGASQLDGAPIVVIATGLEETRNVKTGAVIQTWILRSDIAPTVAAKVGADASVCGDCPSRGRIEGGENIDRACYVVLFHSPLSVWSTYKRGRYLTAWDADTFAGRVVRLGSYGDPAAVPFHVWSRLLAGAAGHTGYTHQWSRFPELAAWCMASCDSERDRLHARLLGFRTFRVRAQGAPVFKSEVICPASREAGAKTVCADCRACGGTTAKARADIVIEAHGAANKVAAWLRVHAPDAVAAA